MSMSPLKISVVCPDTAVLPNVIIAPLLLMVVAPPVLVVFSVPSR